MFYCDPCGSERGWPTYYGMPMSRGQCEVCKKVRGCYDVPSRSLPEPKKPGAPDARPEAKRERERLVVLLAAKAAEMSARAARSPFISESGRLSGVAAGLRLAIAAIQGDRNEG